MSIIQVDEDCFQRLLTEKKQLTEQVTRLQERAGDLLAELRKERQERNEPYTLLAIRDTFDKYVGTIKIPSALRAEVTAWLVDFKDCAISDGRAPVRFDNLDELLDWYEKETT
jgi:hypothetical protein